MEQISWTDRVRKEEVLVIHRVKEGRRILQTKRTANLIGHIWHWNYHLKHVFEGPIRGRIAVTGRRGRRSKQLLDDVMRLEVTGNSKRNH
jgi:hypothetical protein